MAIQQVSDLLQTVDLAINDTAWHDITCPLSGCRTFTILNTSGSVSLVFATDRQSAPTGQITIAPSMWQSFVLSAHARGWTLNEVIGRVSGNGGTGVLVFVA